MRITYSSRLNKGFIKVTWIKQTPEAEMLWSWQQRWGLLSKCKKKCYFSSQKIEWNSLWANWIDNHLKRTQRLEYCDCNNKDEDISTNVNNHNSFLFIFLFTVACKVATSDFTTCKLLLLKNKNKKQSLFLFHFPWY